MFRTRKTKSGRQRLEEALGMLTAALNGVQTAAEELQVERTNLEAELKSVSLATDRAQNVATRLADLLGL
jgi:uncharacterized protein YlxW (UPF0749 family)